MSEKIREMFAGVAKGYDRTNTILSFGIHHWWRKKLIKLSGVQPGMSVLDCATGTGDLAVAFHKAVGIHGSVIGTDFCTEMMDFAPQKVGAHAKNITFELADVMNLPYPDNSFDICSIAFGIRNVDNPRQALREMARVVRPGGLVLVLEFGQPNGFFGYIYTVYSTKILPIVGGLFGGNKGAYQYLQKSSASFPSGQSFLAIVDEVGCFSECKAIQLTRGIVYIYYCKVY